MVWTATAEVNDDQRGAIQRLLARWARSCSSTTRSTSTWRPRFSGTGPTYVFLMMEALIDAGVHMGFPRRIAEQIVLQTVSGSVDFARVVEETYGRAAEHGHLSRRHLGRGDLSNGEGRTSHRLFPRGLRRLSTHPVVGGRRGGESERMRAFAVTHIHFPSPSEARNNDSRIVL